MKYIEAYRSIKGIDFLQNTDLKMLTMGHKGDKIFINRFNYQTI